MKPILVAIIKSLSIVFMIGAIGLDLWQLPSVLMQNQHPVVPWVIFWWAQIALVVHSLEGMIAGVYALRQQKSPLGAAVYTFFVGTVGLVELVRAAPD